MHDLTLFFCYLCCPHMTPPIPPHGSDGNVSAGFAFLLFHIRGCVFLYSSFFILSAIVCGCWNRLVNPSRDFVKRIILLLLKCINIRLWPEINIGLKFRGTCLCPVLNSYLISSSLVVLLFY